MICNQLQRVFHTRTEMSSAEPVQVLHPYDPTDDIEWSDYTPGWESIDTTPEGIILDKYLQWMGSYSKDIIDGFNNWVLNQIRQQVASRFVKARRTIQGITYDVIVRYEDALFVRPTYSIGNEVYDLTPANAKKNHISYLFTIYAIPRMYIVDRVQRNEVWVAETRSQPLTDTIPYQEVAKVPAMLGSVTCHLSGITNVEELMSLGVNPDDPLGYFIIKGVSKAVVNIQKLRLHRIYVLPAAAKGTPYCRITVPTPTGTRQTQIVLDGKRGDLQLQLGSFKKKTESGPASKVAEGVNILHVIEIYSRLVRLPEINDLGGVWLFFRTIVRQFVVPERWSKVAARLDDTHAMYTIKSPVMAFNEMAAFLRINRDPAVTPDINKEVAVKMGEMFTDHLFPNIDKGEPLRKMYCLGIMSARLLEYDSGFIPASDRDAWSNNKLGTAAESVSMVLRLELMRLNSRVQNEIDGTGPQRSEKSRLAAQNADWTLESIVDKFKIKVSKTNEDILDAFNSSNWGKKQNYARNNLTDVLENHNTLEIISHLTKIDVNAERRTKSIAVRGVKRDQCGFICPSAAADDTSCGIVKNKSLGALVTFDEDPLTLILMIQDPNKGLLSGVKTPAASGYVMVNGVFRGWCNVKQLYDFLVTKRREGIYRYAEYIWSRENYLEILTDGGRLMRPLLIVEENGKMAIDNHPGGRNLDFAGMLQKGYVEFIGSAEQERITIAMNPETLDRRLEDIKIKDEELEAVQASLLEMLTRGIDEGSGITTLEQSYANLMMFAPEEIKDLEKEMEYITKARAQLAQPYHYAELHPIAVMGLAAGLIPFMNFNAAARIAYQTKMSKQAMQPAGVNPHLHEGTKYTKMKGNQPIIKTALDASVGLNTRPAGINVILAIASITGYNQEDAFVFNKTSVDAGMFDYVKHFIKDTRRNDIGATAQDIMLPWFDESAADRYHAINHNGLPTIGMFLREGDCVIGKVQYQTNNPPVRDDRASVQETTTNVSEFMKVGEYGIVEDVKVLDDGQSGKYISVKIRCVRRPGVGDKYYFIPSQKGTVGIVVPAENMPFDPETGLRPDVIMNPHAIPSRMTMGILKEMLFGNALAMRGRSYDGTGFQQYNQEEFKEMLVSHFSESRLEWLREKTRILATYDEIADIIPPAVIPEYMTKKLRAAIDAAPTKQDPEIPIPPIGDSIDSPAIRNEIMRILLPDTLTHEMKYQIGLEILKRDAVLKLVNTANTEGQLSMYERRLEQYEPIDNITDVSQIPDKMTPRMTNIMIKILNDRNEVYDSVRNFQKMFQSGKMRMKSGIGGRTYTSQIFIAPARMNQQLHIAEYKIQGRARGRVDPVTRQPHRGRSSHGAIKFGTMDLHAVLSHGASTIAQERMCTLSDPFEAAYCQECGVIAEYNDTQNKFECPLCRNSNSFGRAVVPYVLKYLGNILLSVGMIMLTTMATTDTYVEKMLDTRKRKNGSFIQQNIEDVVEEINVNPLDDVNGDPTLSDEDNFLLEDVPNTSPQGYGAYGDYVED
jgi:DNA-directed RNA polymerase beta subunit